VSEGGGCCLVLYLLEPRKGAAYSALLNLSLDPYQNRRSIIWAMSSSLAVDCELGCFVQIADFGGEPDCCSYAEM